MGKKGTPFLFFGYYPLLSVSEMCVCVYKERERRSFPIGNFPIPVTLAKDRGLLLIWRTKLDSILSSPRQLWVEHRHN